MLMLYDHLWYQQSHRSFRKNVASEITNLVALGRKRSDDEISGLSLVESIAHPEAYVGRQLPDVIREVAGIGAHARPVVIVFRLLSLCWFGEFRGQ